VFAPDVPRGPLPPGARWSFDADSLRLAGFFTLSELLARLPGVYVARGGFFGQAENVLYAGRGPAALELYWDGIPYVPLGRDSLYLDPARVSLAPLERVEVSRLPGVLRVYLVTRRQASTHAASSVGVSSGDRNLTRYVGRFARRWRSGAGLSFAFDKNAIDGAAGTSSTGFNSENLWLHGEVTRAGRFGISYQMLGSSWERDPAAGLVDHWRFGRTDQILRLFVSPRPDGLGARFQLAAAHATAKRDSAVPTRYSRVMALDAGLAARRASVDATVRLGDAARPLQLEARGSWTPLGGLSGAGVTLSAEARQAEYRGGRVGRRAIGQIGFLLPLGFSLRGEAVWSRDLQAASLTTVPLQRTLDLNGAVRWDGRWATLEVGAGRRDGFLPFLAPAGLRTIADLHATPTTNTLTVYGSLRPAGWVTVSGWYADPLDGGGDFEPPHHARVSATFFSRFLRVFRSGIFALRGDVAVESWSGWNTGIDSAGATLRLKGSSFLDFNIGLQIGDVTAFWTRRNANGRAATYVPGLAYPRNLYFFGVRWDFRN